MTPREGRRFAWTLATGFALLAIIAVVRHRQFASVALASIAGLAVVAGIVAPTHLGPIERAWLSLGHALSRVTTPLFLGVVYFLIVTPTGWIRRHLSHDPILRDRSARSFWVERPQLSPEQIRESFEHLY
jgi:hypothetical protein